MKKVVNSVLASALALTVAPMAFAEEAATTAPVMDAQLEKTVKRLEALGLVAGYGNGDYGVDKTITRAEFATLIVRARGLEQGAKLAQFQSTFTDVNTADWFSGFVNVASGQDIVKGYADKTFKPQNQVTYAEAVAMIIRALGYDPAVKGAWPNNYIAKASELNIAKNVAAPNNAATRGEVFKMLDNALRVKLMEQVEYGTDIRFSFSNETLLTRYLNVTVRDMDWVNDERLDGDDLPFVTNVPVVGLGTLKANEITIAGKVAGLGNNTTYKVADGINPNEFAGQHVQVWIKDDAPSTIVWIEGSTHEDVVLDRLDEFFLNGKDVSGSGDKLEKDSDIKNLKVSLVGSGKTYKFSDDVKVTYNFKPDDSLDLLQDIITQNDSFSAKIVLNDKNEINYIHVIDDKTMKKSVKGEKYGSQIIEKVDADKKKISNLDGKKFNDLEDLEEGEDFLVFLDNKPATLADLKPMDVYNVYYANGDEDKLLVFANRSVVEGKVEKVHIRSKTDNRLVIGGKTYRFALDKSTYSDNANKDIEDITEDNQDTMRDLDGEEVKLYLDPAGWIRHIETKDSISDRKFKAMVTKQAIYSGGDISFEVISEKGKKHTIEIDADDIKDVDGKDYDEDSILEDFTPSQTSPLLLEVTLDAKGDAEKVKVLKSSVDMIELKDDAWDKAADEDEEIIKHNGVTYEVTSDTAIFDVTGEITGSLRETLKKPGIAKFSKIADEKNQTVLFAVDEEDEEVEAIFLVAGKSASSDMQYGQVLGWDRANNVHTMEVVTKVDNEVKKVTYNLDDKSSELTDRGIRRGDFIAFTMNASDEVEVDEVVEVVDRADVLESLKLIDEDNWADAEIAHITTAIATEVDGNKITYEWKDKEGNKESKTYTVRTNTAYFNADAIAPGDKVEEGDYIVLFSTEDVENRYDYVLFINSEKDVKKYDMDTDSFLAQSASGGDNGGGEPVNGDALATAVTTTQAKHDAAVEGNADGQYAPGSKAAFQAAIDAANAVLNDPSSSQADVDQAVIDLATAEANFDAAEVNVDTTALDAAVSAAQAKHDAADEGSNPGEYAAGSKATFQAAIDAAEAVLNDPASSQADVDQAETDLATAEATFDAAQN